MGRRDEDIPDLATAWRLFDQRIGGGLQVSAEDEHSVHVEGIVHGRAVTVDIADSRSGNAFFREFFHNPGRMRPKIKLTWQSQIVVSTTNPAGWIGTIDSYVDTNHPDWNPRVYDPRNGRIVRTDPPELGSVVLTPSVVGKLSGIIDHVRIHVGATSIGMRDEGRSDTDDGSFVAGSVLHHPVGDPVPWPDRAIVGPWFWFGLLYEIATALEQAR